jgi:periplasmic protein TonB
MMAGISSNRDVGWLRLPIALGLLISAGLHFIFLVLFQVTPVSSGGQVVVINARIQAPASQPELNQDVLVEPLAKAEPDASDKMMLAVAPTNPSPDSSPVDTVPTIQPEPEVKQAVKQEEKQAPATAASLVSIPNSEASAGSTQKSQPAASAEVTRGAQQDTGLPSLPIGIDTQWYLARQVDKQPKAIGLIEPVYPDDAKRRNIEGTLKLMLKIDDLGRVLSAEVVEATPPGVFDAAALAAFRDARFNPAMKDGRQVRYQAYIRVDFRLED